MTFASDGSASSASPAAANHPVRSGRKAACSSCDQVEASPRTATADSTAGRRVTRRGRGGSRSTSPSPRSWKSAGNGVSRRAYSSRAVRRQAARTSAFSRL